MNSFSLAWRNVRRNGRRSLLTLLALVVGTLGILLFGGYVADTVHGLQTSTVRTYGHLQIVPKDYLDFGRSNPGRYSIRNYDELIARIRNDAVLATMVTLATPVLDLEGVAGNYGVGASTNFIGEGVVPSERHAQLSWDGFDIGIPRDRTALSDDQPGAGTIGVGLAQLLSLCETLAMHDCKRQPVVAAKAAKQATAVPNDVAAIASMAQDEPSATTDVNGKADVAIELLAASPSSLPNVVRMNVLRAERQGIRQVDSMYVAMPLRLAQRLVFGPDVKAVSSILVQLRHTDMLEPAVARLNTLIHSGAQPLEVLDFHDISPVYDQIIVSYMMIFQFIAVLMTVITIFSVANAVNMAVSERTGEIGTLRSLGFQRHTVRRIFLIEGTLLGLGGTLIGAVLALVVSVVINVSGLGWTPPGRTEPVPIAVEIGPLMLVAAVFGLTLVACLAAFWPAHRAARMEVTEALRHV
jgi:putative ABC transport system permease protein